jgi:putative hydrolase of the HAD superfamily
MVKAIIFDADGMIVHGDRFSDRLTTERGISTTTTGPFFKESFSKCLIGQADLKIELAKYIDQWGWKDGVDALLEFWFDEKHNMIDDRFSPIIAGLRARGIKCYIATNNEKYRTENLIGQRGLGKWFDAVFSSADIGSKKPEHSFFDAIMRTIPETHKEEVVFWDDDLENVAGAKTYGMMTAVYTDFENFKSGTQNG